jgi:hypothetical protein
MNVPGFIAAPCCHSPLSALFALRFPYFHSIAPHYPWHATFLAAMSLSEFSVRGTLRKHLFSERLIVSMFDIFAREEHPAASRDLQDSAGFLSECASFCYRVKGLAVQI